ncbi:MAG: hypothetical protein JWQ50_1449, partial [Caballeronia mineralivorans]|nr:hypothetical protein [Caballeronia mineralivorans]
GACNRAFAAVPTRVAAIVFYAMSCQKRIFVD